MKVTFKWETMDAAELKGLNPLPFFRGESADLDMKNTGGMKDEESVGLGKNCARRVLPYLLQDKYGRDVKPRPMPVATVENEYLIATFLCSYGGRLYSLYDKEKQREVFFRNPVIQPCDLALRDAWLSGGIEWNIGQFGHTFTTSSPMYCAKLHDKDGNEFLRIYEYERQKRLFWQVDMHLPSGSRQMYYHVRIVNDHEETPMYWWTNTAAIEDESTRIFTSADRAMYKRIDLEGEVYDIGKLPFVTNGNTTEDYSYTLRAKHSRDFFYQTPDDYKAPWEAVSNNGGALTFDRSTSLLHYRKLFCWGNIPGGWRWKEFLSKEGDGSYVELQAGIGRSQQHGFTMPANTTWEFTAAIGTIDIDTSKAYASDWYEANDYIYKEIDSVVSEKDIYDRHDMYCAEAVKAPEKILFNGSGWGALEVLRREKFGLSPIPEGYEFPASAIGDEQMPWLYLMNTGVLPDGAPISYMVAPEWREMLENLDDSWQKFYHLGVAAVEDLDRKKAREYFEKSIKLSENPWNLRALAVISESEKLLKLYEKIYNIGFPEVSFAQEYMVLLNKNKEHKKAVSVYYSLSKEWQKHERIYVEAVRAEVALGITDLCEQGFFEYPFAHVREGEVGLSDIWYDYMTLKLAKERGVKPDKNLRDEIVSTMLPPKNVDFRMR